MLGLIIKQFLSSREQGQNPPAGVNREDKLKVAAAAIFLEIAQSDSHFAREEFTAIREILKSSFQIREEDIREIIRVAQEERKKSTDLYRFTNLINEHLTREEKLGMMEKIWQVVYADGIMHKYEDYLAHKLAALLRLNHAEMIAAKMKVKQAKGL